MNLYETEWLARERLAEALAHAAREAMIRQALADRPGLRPQLGSLLIRLGTWLQGRTADTDVEAKRAAA